MHPRDIRGDARRLVELLDSIAVGVYSVSADLRSVLYVNPSMEALFGHSAEEFAANPRLWLDAIVEEDRPRVGDPAVQALAEGTAQHVYRVARPDGQVIWLLDQTRCIKDRRGKPQRLHCVFTDITRRMDAERALREGSAHLRQFADHSPVGILIEDCSGHVTYANEQAAALFGNVLARPADDRLARVHPDDRARVAHELGDTRAAGGSRRVEFRVHRPDGAMCSVRVVRIPLLEPSGTLLGFADAAHDITEEQRAELALRASEREYRSVIENIQEAFFRSGGDDRVLMASPSAAKLFGYQDAPAMLGESTASFWADDVARRRCREQLDAAGELLDYEGVLKRQDGTTFAALLSVHYYTDEQGNRLGVEGVVHDVTEATRAREQLRALPQQIMRAQEEERRTIARELHDTAIQTLISLKLRCDEAHRDPALGTSRAMAPERLSADIGEVVAQLRALAASLRPVTLDLLGLPAALRTWVSHVADEHAVDISLFVDPDLPRTGAEMESHCFRIVQEAVTNAVRHSQAAHVRVRVERIESDLVVVVGDDGRGFAVEERRRCALQTGHFGLSVLEERVSALGGTLDIHSGPVDGTELLARLPLTR